MKASKESLMLGLSSLIFLFSCNHGDTKKTEPTSDNMIKVNLKEMKKI